GDERDGGAAIEQFDRFGHLFDPYGRLVCDSLDKLRFNHASKLSRTHNRISLAEDTGHYNPKAAEMSLSRRPIPSSLLRNTGRGNEGDAGRAGRAWLHQ